MAKAARIFRFSGLMVFLQIISFPVWAAIGPVEFRFPIPKDLRQIHFEVSDGRFETVLKVDLHRHRTTGKQRFYQLKGQSSISISRGEVLIKAWLDTGQYLVSLEEETELNSDHYDFSLLADFRNEDWKNNIPIIRERVSLVLKSSSRSPAIFGDQVLRARLMDSTEQCPMIFID